MTGWIATWWHERRQVVSNAPVEGVQDTRAPKDLGVGQHLITVESAGLLMAVACGVAVCGG